ncbi:MAG TPA: trypsin-like serine protease [Actinomycetes bacterium]|nr:trypsin-like serine protease [Actinomycetes bacterium]
MRITSSKRTISKGLTAVLVAVAGLVLSIGPAGAITFGQPDGNLHPNVGAVLADYDPDSPGPDILCSGTLIAPTVFLTASHCTAFLEAEGISQVWVTFAPAYDEDSTSVAGLLAGSYVTNPQFGSGGASDSHDIAVVLLAQAPAGITPAQLPTAALLDQLKAAHQLDEQTFTAVGYGTVREDKTGGPHSLFFDGVRRYALQHALNLEKAWLLLSMNPSTGNGGTCYGDSGGPHFLGGVTSNLVVSITITGDAWCRASDKTYRLDAASARAFLGDFVTLP